MWNNIRKLENGFFYLNFEWLKFCTVNISAKVVDSLRSSRQVLTLLAKSSLNCISPEITVKWLLFKVYCKKVNIAALCYYRHHKDLFSLMETVGVEVIP